MTVPLIGIDYGGPSAAATHANRLLLVGSGLVPDLFLASKVGGWQDFETSTTTAQGPVTTEQDGFWLQQVSARQNGFHAVAQQEGLFVFGDVGEAAVPPGPFHGGAVEIRENSWVGSDLGRSPIIVGSVLMFLQKGGQDIRAIAWTEAERKYLVPSMLAVAGRIFDQALEMCHSPSAGDIPDAVIVVDQSGSMGVLWVKDRKPNFAWTKWITPLQSEADGSVSAPAKIAGVASPLGQAVFLVERLNEDNKPEVFLEVLDEPRVNHLDGGYRERDTDFALFRAPPWMRGTKDFVVTFRDIEQYRGQCWVDEAGELWQLGEDVNGEAVQGGTKLVASTEVGAELAKGMVLSIEVGTAFARRMESLPFIAPSKTGPRGAVRRSRITDIAVDWVGLNYPQQVRLVTGRVKRRTTRQARNENGVWRTRYPGAGTWSYRTTVGLEAAEHYEIAGMNYKASG